jgi:hypothetical protein
MNKIFSYVGIFIALMVAAIIVGLSKKVGEHAFKPESSPKSDVKSALVQGFRESADELNQSLPSMIDKETRLDRVTVGSDAVLTYHYTFPNYEAEKLSSDWIRTELRPGVVRRVCNNEDMKPSLQYGGIYSYSYSGRDQKLIGSFQVSRGDCGYVAITP